MSNGLYKVNEYLSLTSEQQFNIIQENLNILKTLGNLKCQRRKAVDLAVTEIFSGKSIFEFDFNSFAHDLVELLTIAHIGSAKRKFIDDNYIEMIKILAETAECGVCTQFWNLLNFKQKESILNMPMGFNDNSLNWSENFADFYRFLLDNSTASQKENILQISPKAFVDFTSWFEDDLEYLDTLWSYLTNIQRNEIFTNAESLHEVLSILSDENQPGYALWYLDTFTDHDQNLFRDVFYNENNNPAIISKIWKILSNDHKMLILFNENTNFLKEYLNKGGNCRVFWGMWHSSDLDIQIRALASLNDNEKEKICKNYHLDILNALLQNPMYHRLAFFKLIMDCYLPITQPWAQFYANIYIIITCMKSALKLQRYLRVM